MDQTTLPRPSAQPALYDLLARCWPTESTVTAHCFDRNMTTVAFALADGRVALVPLADPEPPEKRIRQEVDTGRSTPLKPNASSLACVRFRFSKPQRACSGETHLPLP